MEDTAGDAGVCAKRATPASDGASGPAGKQARRIAPTPVTVSAPVRPAPAEADHDDVAVGGSESESAEEDLSALRDIDDEERQALIDRAIAAQAEVDHWAALLEGGAEDRPLGAEEEGIAPERLEAEREMLADLQAEEDAFNERAGEHGAEGGDLADAGALASSEAACELRAEYEEEVSRCYDEALEACAALQEELEASGVSLVALQAALGAAESAAEKRARADAGADADAGGEGGASARKCDKCGRLGARPISAAATEGGEVGASEEAAGEERQLCYVCSAEVALDAARPVATRHGRTLERGACGFTGWTSGLRRTSDEAALKKMYKLKRPQQVADAPELASSLHIDAAMGAPYPSPSPPATPPE